MCTSFISRLLFGNTNLYVFTNPAQEEALRKKKKDLTPPTYESAQEEIAKNSGMSKLTKGAGKSKSEYGH